MHQRAIGRCMVAAMVLAAGVAGCGGGSAGNALPLSAASSKPGTTNIPAGSTALTYGASYLQNAQLVGPARFGSMGVNVGLRLQNASGLVQYAQAASNPHSPLYRHFLTPAQIGRQFGASQPDYQTAATYFEKYGLHVGGWPQRLLLYVSGSQPNLERAFGTKFGVFTRNGERFVAPMQPPSLPSSVAVTAIGNMVTAKKFSVDSIPVRAGNGFVNGYLPSQLRNVFDYTGAYKAGYTGAGITIGIIGTGPISSQDAPAYASMFHVNVAPVTQINASDEAVGNGTGVPLSGGLASPPPVTAPCFGGLPDCNQEDGEAQIDTEQAAALAPGSNVYVYLAYNPGECFQPGSSVPAGQQCPSPAPAGQFSMAAEGIMLTDDEIQQAIADDTADVLSLSYGIQEITTPQVGGAADYYFDSNNPTSGFGPTEFAALAAEGVAVFVSSGDSGAETCQRAGVPGYQDSPCVSYPATDPSVTSVGGVTTPVDQFGNLTNQITAWGLQTTGGYAGSGGGVSAYFPMPSWQRGIPGAMGTNRNQPDLSLEADASTGVATVQYAWTGSPLVGSYGGTSVAAPEMAAMWALVLQGCKSSPSCGSGIGTHAYRLGNPAPLLYSLYSKNGAVAATYASTFYDVVYGNNSQAVASPGPTPVPSGVFDPGYNAGPGYDLVTGLGVPFARALIRSVAGI